MGAERKADLGATRPSIRNDSILRDVGLCIEESKKVLKWSGDGQLKRMKH